MTDNDNSDDDTTEPGTPVPFRRLSRLAGLGGMAVNIAGGMAAKGVKELASGNRPKIENLFMTPSNALKMTKQLSKMRGAAMKIGQMISMDSGDLLPKEFADVLARLRADARHMPRDQLLEMLDAELGADWPDKFYHFNQHPIAAASIGQVHRAFLEDGQALALKVQYPGVRESIDSDINNVASLLRLSRMVPANMDIDPIIEEARRQLHQEADYVQEAAYLERFNALLADDEDFWLPEYFPDLSTDRVLAMSYIPGRSIDSLEEADQDIRNHVVSLLVTLTMRELFEFKLMQTDPNFANYMYDPDSERIVLLDFGASRDIDDDLVDGYRQLLRAFLSGEGARVYDVMVDMGFMPENMDEDTRVQVQDLIEMAIGPLTVDAPFDFGSNPMAIQMREKAMELSMNRELWHAPPASTIFIQRKLGGVYMLATRLKAEINIHALLRDFVG